VALTKTELKYLTSMHNKKGRTREGRFLADGVRLLEEALAAGYLPLSVMYAPSEIGPRGEKLVGDFSAQKVETRSISSRECHRISETKTSQGIVALFEYKSPDLSQQLVKDYRRILVCDRLGDPGNLGALIRSAVAFGFEAVITTEDSAEITNPKTVRASMGGFFKIPLFAGVPAEKTALALKKHGFHILEAGIKGRNIDSSLTIPKKAALVIGSEATGTGPALVSAADLRLRIPMSPKTESLNSAMAGTVLMFWINWHEREKNE